MKSILLNSFKLMNITQAKEKEAAQIMYATAFFAVMKSGTLYRKGLDKAGFPCYYIVLDNKEYRCSAILIDAIADDSYKIVPYEDTTAGYLSLLPLQYESPAGEETDSQDKVKKGLSFSFGKKKNSVEQSEDVPESNNSESEVQALKQELKELKQKQEESQLQITLSNREQEQILIDEMGFYKVNSMLVSLSSLACIVLATAVLLL